MWAIVARWRVVLWPKVPGWDSAAWGEMSRAKRKFVFASAAGLSPGCVVGLADVAAHAERVDAPGPILRTVVGRVFKPMAPPPPRPQIVPLQVIGPVEDELWREGSSATGRTWREAISNYQP